LRALAENLVLVLHGRLSTMIYQVLSGASDVVHALAMVVWVVGLPLLFWHRRPRLSRAYLWYALAFVIITWASHWIWGECVLTRLSRDLWNAGGRGVPEHGSFTVRLVNAVAGVRFSEHSAVLLWEISVFVCSAGMLFYLYKQRRRQRERDAKLAPRQGPGVSAPQPNNRNAASRG
jgi:hypothetical protein